jgi:hypothetical protein
VREGRGEEPGGSEGDEMVAGGCEGGGEEE